MYAVFAEGRLPSTGKPASFSRNCLGLHHGIMHSKAMDVMLQASRRTKMLGRSSLGPARPQTQRGMTRSPDTEVGVPFAAYLVLFFFPAYLQVVLQFSSLTQPEVEIERDGD